MSDAVLMVLQAGVLGVAVWTEHQMGPCLWQPLTWRDAHNVSDQTVYEQDWLDVEMQNLYWMLESPTAGATWLQQARCDGCTPWSCDAVRLCG